jgi:chemotaxis protein MotB
MAKRRKPEEEHADESWLIPYADILTLLLALFIVLFAMSNVDQDKYDAMMKVFYQEFGGKIITDDGGASGGTGIMDPDFPINPSEPTPSPTPTPDPNEGEGDDSPTMQLYEMLQKAIKDNGLENSVGVQKDGEAVLITLTNDINFASGSAELTPTMRNTATIIAGLLQTTQDPDDPFDIIVTGHTDNVPMHTAQYASNWELSLGRAVNFMKQLLADSELSPTIFSCRGYGEFAPIDTNDTPDGRQRNRRVEVLVSQAVASQAFLDYGDGSAGGQDGS